MARLDLLVTY